MFERLQEIENLIDYKIASDFLVYTPEEIEKHLKIGDPFIKSVLERGKVVYEE